MGNCECVAVDLDPRDTIDPLAVLTLDILEEEPCSEANEQQEDLISFTSISVAPMPFSMNSGHSLCPSLSASLSNELTNYQLELHPRVSIKEFYELKRLIETIEETIQ